MDEQELQRYGQLIERLLNCSAGEENNILHEHQELVNPQLLVAIAKRAEELREQGRKHQAIWLRQLVEQLAQAMGLGSSAGSSGGSSGGSPPGFDDTSEFEEEDDEGEGRTRSLQDFYLRISGIAFRDPVGGRSAIKKFIKQRHRYTGPADIWYNLAAETGRLQLSVERGLIVEEGLKEHPESIDLLCEVLQGSYSLYSDPKTAQETWTRLEVLEESKFYWRYWVYGAIYHSRLLKDQEKALDLLEQGLCHVSSDHLNDVVRAYRRILIDSPPNKGIETREQRQQNEEITFQRLEDIYKWSISLGVEDSYELATGLAKLYQERAEFNPENKEPNNPYLEEALHYLSLAEARYTASSNHPVWEIYIAEARIYMGQKRYADALKLFQVLPKQFTDDDPSILVQHDLAARMVGYDNSYNNSYNGSQARSKDLSPM